MLPLTMDDALRIANQLCLFVDVYRALESRQNRLSAQEHFLMAVAAVEQQTGPMESIPTPLTHEWVV